MKSAFPIWAMTLPAFKIFVWTLSAGIAGIAGGLFVPLNRFISPVYLGVAFGTQVVIWVAVGGRGTLVGPLIAAILLGQLQNSVDRITQDWQLIVGIILLVVVLFLPDGLMGLLPKSFKLVDAGDTPSTTPSSSTSGFVQARLFDWFTPLQQMVHAVGRSLTASLQRKGASTSARSTRGRRLK